ncbi:hypothetical protein TSMEX_007806 [Taenia solium]
MVDYFTKLVEAELMRSQDADPPKLICSDQGPNIESQQLIGLCKTFEISKARTTPGRAQGNGLLKAFNKETQPVDLDIQGYIPHIN